MNRPPEEFVRVEENRLLDFATTCLQKVGLETEHAELVSRLLVNSDLRGVHSHGTGAVCRYCVEHESGALNPDPRIEVVHETPATVVLDGNGSLGYLPTMNATELAIAKARQVGIGMGLVRAIGHYGSSGHYTRVCMEAGCIGFSVQGPEGYGDYIGSPRHLDRTPSLGEFGCPPMSWAMPGGSEPAIVLDGGTPTMMGLRDSDAFKDVMSKIPSGVFKGVGLTAVSNLLSAGLTGLALPNARELRECYSLAQKGSMVMAIHIGALPGYDRALMPGAIEEEIAREHRANGIRYGGWEQEEAHKASERYDVSLPWD